MGRTSVFLVMAVVALTLLRFLHLTADFPLGISKSGDLYTDEGWYTSGAVRHAHDGAWHMEGDFNPAVNLPVFQSIQAGMFSLLGPGLLVARLTVAICFVALAVLVYVLTRKATDKATALLAAFILSSNFYLFAYSRFAINEILLALLLMAALGACFTSAVNRPYMAVPLAALLFVLALLTKTTAAFAAPAMIYLLLQGTTDRRVRWQAIGLFVGVAALGFGAVSVVLASWYPEDYNYFQALNLEKRAGLDPFSYVMNISRTLGKPLVIDILLYPAAILGAIFLFVRRRPPAENIWLRALALWWLGYLLLINVTSYQPSRYAVPLAVALAPVGAMLFMSMLRSTRRIQVLAVIMMAFYFCVNLLRVGVYILQPEYSLIRLGEAVERASLGLQNSMVIGDMANTVGLLTGLPAINTQLGVQNLAWKLDRYNPTLYVAQEAEPDILAELETRYSVVLVEEVEVMGNYATGKPVRIYRLEPKPAALGN